MMESLNRQFIDFTTEEAWLADREKDLTSTEIAALFGVSPYMTHYELWHRKTGQLAVEFEGNERTKWGNRLESAIALGVAEDLGLVVEPFKVYARVEDRRLGSSFDFKITGLAKDYTGEENDYRDLFRRHGPGIMEVKNVDGLVFRRSWLQDGELVEAPPHIELQVQHQMLVSGLSWACVAPLVAGNTPTPFYRAYDPKIGAAIMKRAEAFWASVEEGKAPTPEYAKDADTIATLLLQDDGESVDLTDNARFAEVCAAYKAASADEKAAIERKRAAKGEILEIMGTAATATTEGFKVSAKTRKGNPGKTITPEMVGEIIGARKATRYPTITPVKG
jgi:putative phage-type endonuclease